MIVAPVPLMRATLGLVVLVLCAGCAAADSAAAAAAPSDQPTVEVEVIPLENRLILARAALAAGDYREVLDLLADADSAASAEMRAEQALLKTEARRHLVQSEIVDAWLDGPALVTLGDPVELRMVLANVGSEPVAIASHPQGGSSASTLRIDATCREWPSDGTVAEHRLVRSLELGADVLLKHAEQFTARCTLDTLEIAPESPTVRTYVIKAVLHTAGLKSGASQHVAAIQFRTLHVTVLPRNWEPLAADPLRSLMRAVERRALVHIPVIAVLLPETAREEARRLLETSAISPDEGLARAARVALGILAESSQGHVLHSGSRR